MRELVVISGKGGTGKTSITASLSALACNCVVADCDVDAADLRLILEKKEIRRESFYGGNKAVIDQDKCISCAQCADICRFDAIEGASSAGEKYMVDQLRCEGCGVCAWFCPEHAIRMEPVLSGHWYTSTTAYGSLIHARLKPGEGNSGKLVSLVRREARKLAAEQKKELVIIDGPPGTGCPVIASITGASAVLIVTEPTVSGVHDVKRVAELVKHFGIPAFICINKWDINPDMTNRLIDISDQENIKFAGKVEYGNVFREAQSKRLPIVEYAKNGCAGQIRALWDFMRMELNV